MKFLILNGSPKGEYSITLHTAMFLEKKFPGHEYEVLHVGKKIRAFEKDFSDAKKAIERAQAIIFAYPVYTFIATGQLHRFIELMKASGIDLSGKIATQITTSKHFYDITAHNYIQENCQDMGMRFVRGLSADMEDLTTEKGRLEAESYFKRLVFSIENSIFEPNRLMKSQNTLKKAEPSKNAEKTIGGRVAIVADLKEDDEILESMINRLQSRLPVASSVYNIRKINIMGGCLGCFRCAAGGKCVYTDGFDRFLREEIETADAIVYAFSISDHSMGARFKMFDDRRFCNGHRPVTEGTPIAFIVNGDVSCEPNLSMILEARSQVGGNALSGIADSASDVNAQIDAVADSIGFMIENHYTEPQNFYGVGGMKIFRDLIFQMRGLMRADHRYYKSHGKYDFPQKNRGTIIKMQLVGMLMNNKKIQAKMGNRLNEGMVAPYKKVLENLKESEESGGGTEGKR